jgi:hypothetical protein
VIQGRHDKRVSLADHPSRDNGVERCAETAEGQSCSGPRLDPLRGRIGGPARSIGTHPDRRRTGDACGDPGS